MILIFIYWKNAQNKEVMSPKSVFLRTGFCQEIEIPYLWPELMTNDSGLFAKNNK